MNDRLDTELARLRDRLQTDAARTADSAKALAALRAGEPATPRVTVDRRRRNRLVAAVAATALVAASVVAVVVTRPDDHDTTVPATVAPTTPSESTVPTTTGTTTTPSSVPTGAEISDASSVWFDDPRIGFTVVGDGVSNSEVYGTADGGATWQSVGTIEGAPYGGRLTFADISNGWLASESGFWSTHDGGHTWKPITAPLWATDGGPSPVVADHGRVYAAGGDGVPEAFTVYSSPVNVDQFTPTGITFQGGAGPVSTFSIAAADGNLWAIYNDRVFGGLGRLIQGKVDTQTKPPAWDQGGSMSITVARDGGPIYTSSLTGIWGGDSMANVAAVSTDGGTTFSDVTLPANAHGTDHPDNVELTAIDANTVGVALAAADGSSTTLHRSTDHGTTWTQVSTLTGWLSGLRYVDASTVIATLSNRDGSSRQAVRSDDGGVTWTPLLVPAPLAPPTTTTTVPVQPTVDNISQVQFIDATHGWMLAESNGSADAVVSRTDDGRSWATVTTTPGGVDQMTFADMTNGWVSGSAGMWSTHDGGATWTHLQLGDPGLSPYGPWIADGFAYVLVGHAATDGGYAFDLYRSPVGDDSFTATGLTWSKGAGGNDVEASIATQAKNVFVAYNDRGGSTSRLVAGTAEQRWTTPVTGKGGNISITADGDAVYVASATDTWAPTGQPTLVVAYSTDAGKSFSTMRLPKQKNGTPYRQYDIGPFAATGGNTLLIGLTDDAGVVHLYRTTDHGGSWTKLPALPDPAVRLAVSNGIVTAVLNTDTVHAAWVSTDAGSTWTRVFG